MKKDTLSYRLIWLLVLATALGFSSCRTNINLKNDPFYGSFYEKTQIIMTGEEKDIYKLLPNETSRAEFIEEFWRIRDPDLGTVENENKIEFEARVDYANKWFGRWNPSRGRERTSFHHDDKGWNTDRGHIFILLGPPDELHYDSRERIPGDRIRSRSQGQRSEQWIYYIFRIAVQFRRTPTDSWYLVNPSSELVQAMETSKMILIDPGFRLGYDWRFKFTARYRDDGIILSIPRERLNFKDATDKLIAELWIKIDIYIDNLKIDSLEETRKIEGTEEELFELKEIHIHFPYIPEKKGKFIFDIIAEDKMAVSFAKYRRLIKKTFSAKRKEPLPI